MRHFFLIAFLFIAVASQAQTKLIKGRIVDSQTQEGIAYTNIGIEGTYYGTASDADGFFELKIPDEFAGKMLFVSAVGYTNKSISVPELLQKDFARIAINEQTYNIEGIDVAAQSRVLYRITLPIISISLPCDHEKNIATKKNMIENRVRFKSANSGLTAIS